MRKGNEYAFSVAACADLQNRASGSSSGAVETDNYPSLQYTNQPKHTCKMVSQLWESTLHVCKIVSQPWESILHVCKMVSQPWESILHVCKMVSQLWESTLHVCKMVSQPWESTLHVCKMVSQPCERHDLQNRASGKIAPAGHR